MVATLGAAFVAEGLDMLFAAVTARIRGRSIGGCCDAHAASADLGPALRAHRRGSGLGVHGGFAVDSAALLHSGARCPKPLRHVPASATARRGSEASEHVVRGGARRDAREERSVHSGSLQGRRDLLARHRRADGASPDAQERTYLCGLVHDIGKIGLPASFSLKDGPLTLEERRLMQEHPAIGESNLEEGRPIRRRRSRSFGTTTSGSTARAIRTAPGDDIPLLSRIIAVADAYNAMTSNRAYRDAMPSRVARLGSPRPSRVSLIRQRWPRSKRFSLERPRTTGRQDEPTSSPTTRRMPAAFGAELVAPDPGPEDPRSRLTDRSRPI